jgi:hypothetical protein
MRGYAKPNVEYSIFTSKRRIGAFAVKGWVAGKSYSTLARKDINSVPTIQP